ncbi:LysR substrate-binding domain-containing protein [Vibrio salinus]|uniref:LysR substrate-binding domain-containing protein n=1 Tax=Vibrio salinus TaxID=2899784 RepID=UPI001E5162F3|nr:LysR substrate-binding domain-containing protein [Vibrio salinus]MCE0496223.1 LysR substrate-binding domain-containing protein [Vibrio salinus]
MIKLENLDLNLIKVFYFIYKTQSVNIAAEKLNLSQSACSHSLARLRERLDDELFIRINNRMTPTERAKELAAVVTPALDLLQGGLTTSVPFNPDSGSHHFVISATDFIAWCLMPKLSACLANHYPNITIRLVQGEERIPSDLLESGDIDIALGFDHDAEYSSQIGNAVWLKGEYCIAMDSAHTELAGQDKLNLEAFLKYPHILVTPWNEKQGIVDDTLAKRNKKRKVAITLPSVLSAPYLLKETNYLLALPDIYARTLTESLNIVCFKPPIAIPDFQIKLYWHKIKEKDAKISWLINLLLSLAHD